MNMTISLFQTFLKQFVAQCIRFQGAQEFVAHDDLLGPIAMGQNALGHVIKLVIGEPVSFQKAGQCASTHGGIHILYGKLHVAIQLV